MCNFYADVSFQLLWVNTGENDYWMYGKGVQFHKKLPDCLPKWLHYSASPPTMNQSFCCSTSSLAFGVVLDFGHPNRFVVIFHCFLHNTYGEHLFIYLFATCIFSLVGCLNISSPFFILYFFVFMLFNFRIYLYTILQKHFIRFVFYKYFLPAGSLYFHSNIVLCRAEILNINCNPICWCFSFMGYASGVVPKRSSPNQKCRPFPMLSSKSFIVLCSTFRSMMHFEFIFGKSINLYLGSLCVCGCGFPVVPIPFVERSILPQLNFLFPFVKH